jgi:selenide, water dikinase
LAHVLRRMIPTPDPRLLVGTATGDDAAVWRLDDRRALVVTADFITPVVDDARAWGRIAATNAVSDVYAMGGRPLFALNLVAWNTEELSTELLGEVLAGGADVALAAGYAVAGGHTVDDPEPKFGLAVVGEADPERLLTNAGLRAGDVLVLSKPLGVGVATTAVKRGVAPPGLEAAAIELMTTLNADAAAVALDLGSTGATDVTGFGLLGHLGRMALESSVDVTLDADAVPMLDGVRELAAEGVVPGGSLRNLDWVRDRLVVEGVDEVGVLLLADAQTSGGLVFGVSAEAADEAVARLRATGHLAAVVGAAAAGHGTIVVRSS